MGCVMQSVRGLDIAAEGFLELASEQRLEILTMLYGKNLKISVVAKEIGATVPEVFRNFERLARAGLISKEPDGSYSISTAGRLMYNQITLVKFLSDNKKYLQTHRFSDLPPKFLERMGAFEDVERVKGVVNVLEKWKQIYNDAQSYIRNVLYEVPYTQDFVEPIAKKASSGIKVRSVFSKTSIIPSDRKRLFEKHGFRKLIDEGKIERRMSDDVKIVVILNEREAFVLFPGYDGSPDMSEAFYSDGSKFHEWCLDYFEHSWNGAGQFSENKLHNT